MGELTQEHTRQTHDSPKVSTACYKQQTSSSPY